MQLKQIDREPYYRIDIKTDVKDADYAYRSVDVRECEYGEDFPLLLANLRLIQGTLGEHHGLEKLFASDVLESDLLFDILPCDRFCNENRYSAAGHTLESMRIRYYADKEYEVILEPSDEGVAPSRVLIHQEPLKGVKFKKKEIAALHRYVRDGRVQHMGTMAPVKVYWDFLRAMILEIGLLDVDEWDDLACEEEFSLSSPNQEDWPINAKFVASNVLAMYA